MVTIFIIVCLVLIGVLHYFVLQYTFVGSLYFPLLMISMTYFTWRKESLYWTIWGNFGYKKKKIEKSAKQKFFDKPVEPKKTEAKK